MGRKSLAVKLYEQTENIPEQEGTWLVLYDFKGIKPSSKYWTNLNRLIDFTGGGSLVQYSVFTTKDKRAAAVAKRLAEHYGAAVVPTRIRRPRDKAKAEAGVQGAERWILARLRHRRFFSLGELTMYPLVNSPGLTVAISVIRQLFCLG